MNTINSKPAINPAEKAQRSTTIMAMERLILSLGGRTAYIKWLADLPEDAELNGAGGLSQKSLIAIAENDEQYSKMVTAFAECMLPTMEALADK